jgi:hypothetical protein
MHTRNLRIRRLICLKFNSVQQQYISYINRKLQAAQFNIEQCAQAATIISQLRPFPQQAYTVANLYTILTATA